MNWVWLLGPVVAAPVALEGPAGRRVRFRVRTTDVLRDDAGGGTARAEQVVRVACAGEVARIAEGLRAGETIFVEGRLRIAIDPQPGGLQGREWVELEATMLLRAGEIAGLLAAAGAAAPAASAPVSAVDAPRGANTRTCRRQACGVPFTPTHGRQAYCPVHRVGASAARPKESPA